jgi:outer membrane protein OmpA-like peptidoglycan-associated protein
LSFEVNTVSTNKSFVLTLALGVLAVCVPAFGWQETGSAPDQAQSTTTSDQNQSSTSDQNQGSTNNGSIPTFRTEVVSRTLKAVDYRHGAATRVHLKGTELMPEADGAAKVESRTGRVAISAELDHMRPANSYGLEYLTYVLWAISPQGRPKNLGEMVVHDGKSSLAVTTELQAFGLIVTAEPYFAVTEPSDMVVAQNIILQQTKGREEAVDVRYELLPRGLYAAQVQPIRGTVYGVDKRAPLDLMEARNAVRIAQDAHADQYAASSLTKAQDLLKQAEDYYRRHQNSRAIATVAREASQTAEEARVMTLKREQEAKAEQERQAAADKAAKAQAQAEEEARQRAQAEADQKAAAERAAQAQAASEQARLQAETEAQQRQQAEAQAQAEAQQRQQAEAQAQAQAQAAQQAQQERAAAEQAKAEAEQARQQAELSAQRASQQAQQVAAEKQQAEQMRLQAEQARQQAEQARQQSESEKAQMRARLLQQLNSVLQTKDTARGLIATMPDVLFDTGSATLKPAARERLAKVAGIVLSYPDIRLEIDGHTDNVGSQAFNERLSQQRAESVRSFLAQQGVAQASMTTRGYGPDAPIASNATAVGRQQNRRVELVVSGNVIGAEIGTPANPKTPAQQ